MVEAIPIPEADEGFLRLHHRLGGRGAVLPLTGLENFRLAFAMEKCEAPDFQMVHLTIDGLPAGVELVSAALAKMAPLPGGILPSQLPTDLRMAYAVRACKPVLDSLEKTLGLVVEAAQGPVRTSDYLDSLPFVLKERQSGFHGHGCLHLPAQLADALAARADEWPREESPLWTHAQTICHLVVGRVRISLRDLLSLHPGDALLPDEVIAPDQTSATVRLSCGQERPCRLSAPLQPETLPPLPFMEKQPTPPETTSPTGNPDWPAGLEVEVQFVAGSKSLPLSEIQHLNVGFVFEMDSNPAESITLMIDGRKVGTGSLVKIGNRFAVVVNSVRP